MNLRNIPFGTTDWEKVERTEHQGASGVARWRTQQFGEVRVRIVEYSAGYQSDHWCSKGHILFCLDGELHTALQGGGSVVLKAGMSYQVADDVQPHRSSSPAGAMLFIVD